MWLRRVLDTPGAKVVLQGGSTTPSSGVAASVIFFSGDRESVPWLEAMEVDVAVKPGA